MDASYNYDYDDHCDAGCVLCGFWLVVLVLEEVGF